MISLGARFFRFVQGAGFYQSLFREVVNQLPPGDGRSWLDVGCGPGLVARLAAERGYHSVGVDRSAGMIAEARRASRRAASPAGVLRFEVGDLSDLPEASFDVVSAASLLAVVPNRIAAVSSLWKAVKPGGVLLVIEPTERLNAENADRIVRSGLAGPRAIVLRLWGRARSGRATDVGPLTQLPAESFEIRSYLDGLVASYEIQKPLEVKSAGGSR